jgi:predicted nucleotidyltransferase
MRALPDTLSSEAVARIDATLESIRRERSITIPWAIESGSRAWGFPSPDSDYDCRFIYVRRVEQYLSLWPYRDVIETPLDRELDVNGWDLGKALKLVLKGNAVIIEWLRSPIVYQGDLGFRDEFLALAGRFTDRSLIARHYLHLGQRIRRAHLADEDAVPIKKLFYALRPAAALRWLRQHPDEAIAPMNFPTLMAECELPSELADVVSELLLRKAQTRELGTSPLPAPIASFIASELDHAQEELEGRFVQLPDAAKAEADAFFRRTVERFG